MSDLVACPGCQKPTEPGTLAEAHWYPFWQAEGGACPVCVQQNLLRTLLQRGDAALHEDIQKIWPLDPQAAFGVLPTPLRLHADPRFEGRGVTVALVDSGFYPHADLVEPRNRIRAWADAGAQPVRAIRFGKEDSPRWPDWDGARGWQWHGLMTSVTAAGNGFLSHGLYRGLASEAQLVLIQVRDERGQITNASVTRALRWLLQQGFELGVRVVNLSVAGDPVQTLAGNPVDEAVGALVDAGITVVAAAGNDGQRRLRPPATAPLALTIGGIDDQNNFNHDEVALWHSNYGASETGLSKPELVAPSMWVAASLLPGSELAHEAEQLFARRLQGDRSQEGRIAELKLITPHYQHVNGTSFAAPLVASSVACMLQANPALSPLLVRDILLETAHPVPGAPVERQGAGVRAAGEAVARALLERHKNAAPWPLSPRREGAAVVFALHDHDARRVEVLGSWNGWLAPGLQATEVEPGFWQAKTGGLPPGRHSYKFLIDGGRWLDDPANPHKAPDGLGGFNSVLNIQGR